MALLSLGFQVAAIIALLWGAVLVVGLIVPRLSVALPLAPWVLLTGLFAIETVAGLGSLRGVATLGMGLAAWLVGVSAREDVMGATPAWLAAWRAEFNPRCVAKAAGPFLVAFAYALTWRYRTPDLNEWIEKIPDLVQVTGHSAGAGVPSVDAWLAPHANTHYYTFQHYGAAVLGRLLNLSPGLASNLGFCVLVGCIGAGFASALAGVGAGRRSRWLIWAALLVGGSGVTLLAPWLIEGQRPWERIFLFGTVPMTVAPLGVALEAYAASFPRLSLPYEPLAYSILLGDFHAPLSSYALLGLAIAAGSAWRSTRQMRFAAIVGASITWTVLANPWALPLHGLAVGVWLVWERASGRVLLGAVAGGAAVVWLLTWGFLADFTIATARQSLSFAWLPAAERTPLIVFVILLAPTLLLLIAGLVSGNRTAVRVSLLVGSALVALEFVYFDDSYAGADNRFNTVLKTWPWLASAALLLVAPRVLRKSAGRAAQVLAVGACALPCLYVGDLWRHWRDAGSLSSGQLEGHAFLTVRPECRILLERLRVEPRGVVVQDPRAAGEASILSLPLHAGHAMWLGWDGYSSLWRGFPEDVPHRRRRLEALFDGHDPSAGRWMAAERIDYVLFFREQETGERWVIIDRTLSGNYLWCELYRAGDRPVGFWRRVQPSE